MPAVTAEEQLLPYALCTYQDVQIALQGTPVQGGVSSEQITRLINAFTYAVQGGKHMDRQLEYKARTEYFSIASPCGTYRPAGAPTRRIIVAAPPIAVDGDGVPLLQVWESSDRVYDATTLLTLYTDYDVNLERGIITRLGGGQFAWGPRSVKVAYPGGLVIPADPDAQPPTPPVAPPDLKNACAQQVAVLYARRKDLGLDSIASPGGGAISLGDPTRWLKGVRDAIRDNKIYRSLN